MIQQGPPAKTPQRSAQDSFLRSMIGVPVFVRLIDGKGIVSELLGFDAYSIIVKGRWGAEMLIYKSAIAFVTLPVEREVARRSVTNPVVPQAKDR